MSALAFPSTRAACSLPLCNGHRPQTVRTLRSVKAAQSGYATPHAWYAAWRDLWTKSMPRVYLTNGSVSRPVVTVRGVS